MITNGLVPEFRPAFETDVGRTSQTLLDRVRDWGDHPAWAEFHDCYDPMLRRWCLRFALGADASDELCQRIWFELMSRMRKFRYDPTGGFRKWLWRLFRSRAIDLLRQRGHSPVFLFEELPAELILGLHDRMADDDPEPDHAADSTALALLAVEVQAAVRRRVGADTWRAYWIIAIEDRPIREAADELGKTYTAIYTGYRRVDQMLRSEGQRRLASMQVEPR